MAISTNITNSTPFVNYYGAATRLAARSISIPPTVEVADFCICDIIKCPYQEKIFVHSDNSWWKNDKSDFLFKRIVASDVIALSLKKDGVIITALDNNDYGTLYDGFSSGTTEQQLYYGFLVDWKLVYDAFGVGNYSVYANLTILGTVTEYDSRNFVVSIYSDKAAHYTVRIESTQNGNIIGSQFDFSGLNWYQSIRIPGVFGDPKPIYETDRYVTETRKISQIQDKMKREFTLSTKKINWEVAEKLIYNKMLANEILITDYSLLAETIWRRVGVVPKDLTKSDTKGNPDKTYTITFIDNKEFFIKRNF